MAVEVKIQAFVLRKNISDYPQCIELETATIASAETLVAMKKNDLNGIIYKFNLKWK